MDYRLVCGMVIYTIKSLNMNALPAQKIKRRRIATVVDVLIVAAQEAHYARVRASLGDVKARKVKKFKTAADLLKALEAGNSA